MARPMNLSGKARECAKTVISTSKMPDGYSRAYQMQYFGKAMRAHVELAKEEGFPLAKDVPGLVAQAEKALELCDCKVEVA